MFDNTTAKPDDIWDDGTGETVAQARERFASLAPKEVPAADVPRLVAKGVEVWSFGYGDDPRAFTCIADSDIEGWDPNQAAAFWGPFRA